MNAEILINATMQETRVAIIENGVLQEVFIERSSRRGLVGNIYKGVVTRVLPGMQAAFVDIGLERTAFLHVSNILPPLRVRQNSGFRTLAEQALNPPTEEPLEKETEIEQENISKLLQEGEQILVQVIKDPLGTKGARLTTHLSIPSCYLVFVPGESSIGVSQRIEDENERLRLHELVTQLATIPSTSTEPIPPCGGYIARTAAEAADAAKLRADMVFLNQLWTLITTNAANALAPSLVHADLPLVVRTLRELVGVEIERVRIDSREAYQNAIDFIRKFTPNLVSRTEYYSGEHPIFDLYAVEDNIKLALERKVQLKSGGYIVIDQTEAMTTIDVNTGAYVGHRNLEETIFKTNMEATQTIARQLRLRNLGGIITIDFIDMLSDEHKDQVLRSLEKSLEHDPMRVQVSEVSSLGLVQMTRKRVRESLEHILCHPCVHCHGRGYIKTTETVCYEVFRDILRETRQYDPQKLLVLASKEVIHRLLEEESTNLAELEAFIARPIQLQVEPMYSQAQYDVVFL